MALCLVGWFNLGDLETKKQKNDIRKGRGGGHKAMFWIYNLQACLVNHHGYRYCLPPGSKPTGRRGEAIDLTEQQQVMFSDVDKERKGTLLKSKGIPSAINLAWSIMLKHLQRFIFLT